ncbi:MAG: hypothetical protein FWF50_03885 [Defluviitaleaceae bacterium]|nr:hypothetical protein [Defluviitaleaceae bacterium]
MVKKFISALFLLSITACSNYGTLSYNFQPSYNINSLNISDFISFEENTLLEELSNYGVIYAEVSVTHISNNRIQFLNTIQTYNEPIIATTILEVYNGEFAHIFGETTLISENITSIEPKERFIILQEPLIIGHSWNTDENNGISKIISIDETIQTPFGTFENVMKVNTEFPNGDNFKAYFVKGHGLIKYIVSDYREQEPITRFIKKYR